jgi:multidrug efflux system membrane fusion protein
MWRKVPLLTALSVLGMVGVGLFSRFSAQAAGEKKKDPARVVPVQVAAAKTVDLPVVLSGLGSVVPSQSVTVRSRVAGQLVRLAFREGELVQQGQLLAEVDARPFQAKVAQTAGQLARDRALLTHARSELERMQGLAKNHLISEQALATQASLVAEYQAAERVSVGLNDAAQLELGFTRILAPIRGRVGFRQMDVGNNVDLATPLVVIHAVEPIAVIFTLPEDDVPLVTQTMQRARAEKRALEVEAWDKGTRLRIARGTLLTIDNQIDAATGTVKLKALFENHEQELFPNQFVNVRFTVDVLQGATVVPVASIQRGREGPFVYVVDAQQVSSVRKLELGISADGASVVRSGLEPGELVVVQGVDQVRDGTKVKPQPRPEGNAGPAKLGLSQPPRQP